MRCATAKNDVSENVHGSQLLSGIAVSEKVQKNRDVICVWARRTKRQFSECRFGPLMQRR